MTALDRVRQSTPLTLDTVEKREGWVKAVCEQIERVVHERNRILMLIEMTYNDPVASDACKLQIFDAIVGPALDNLEDDVAMLWVSVKGGN